MVADFHRPEGATGNSQGCSEANPWNVVENQ
jgi:hypothetical protein